MRLAGRKNSVVKIMIKNGKAKAIRFSTLNAICTALDTTPGDSGV